MRLAREGMSLQGDNKNLMEIDAPLVFEGDALPPPAELRRALRTARPRQRLMVEPPAKVGRLRRAAIALIGLYQRFISVRSSRRCVLEPSCSRYAELAIARNGVIAGVIETWHRLHRCRPENEGTIDYPEGVKFCHTK
jgi:putative membrane protein insertion efficiency factor